MYEMIVNAMHTAVNAVNSVVPEQAWYPVIGAALLGIFGWIWHESEDMK